MTALVWLWFVLYVLNFLALLYEGARYGVFSIEVAMGLASQFALGMLIGIEVNGEEGL